MLLIQTGFVSFQKEKLHSSKNYLMCLIIFHFAKTAIQDLMSGNVGRGGKMRRLYLLWIWSVVHSFRLVFKIFKFS